MKIWTVALGTILAMGLGACGMARHVMVEPTGGIVAIPRNHDVHREKAGELMLANCPNGFVIDREEEVPVGTTTQSTGTAEPTETGGEVAVSTETTRTDTEWRISYHCN
jgi:hypothetical protein